MFPRAATSGLALLLSAFPACAPTDEADSSVMPTAEEGACSIAMERVVTLAGDEVNAGLLRMSDSNIFLEENTRVAVFGLDGRFKRFIGGEGSGPGEFNLIQEILPAPDDKLAVLEPVPPRLTILDTLGTPLHTALLPVMVGRSGAHLLPDGTLLVAGRPIPRSRFGSPLVHLGPDGDVLTYFGNNEVETEGFAKNLLIPRVFSYDPRFGVVAVKSHKYHMEWWNLADGSRTRALTREVEWFDEQPTLPDRGDPERAGEPPHVFRGLQIDDEGRAWLVAQIPGPRWSEAVSEEGRVVEYDVWLDTKIEVWDLETAKPLCSATFGPWVMEGFAKKNHIASYREDEAGNPMIDIWRLTLAQP